MYKEATSGLYQKKVRKSNNLSDGYWTVRAKTQAELKRKVAEMEAKRNQGMILTDCTVADWISIWWKNRQSTMSASVQSYRRPMINGVIAPTIGTMKLADVKPEHIRSIMESCSTRSKSYCGKLKQLLSAIFADAVENDLIVKNPCASIKAGGVKTEEKHALTADQWAVLREAVKGTRAELFVNIGYYTGMRREEICGLKWENVHLESYPPHIAVETACTWPDRGKPVITSTLKSQTSRRKIPIHTDLLPMLTEAQNHAQSDFVICMTDGSPLTYMSLRRLWGVVDDRTQLEYLPSSRIREYRGEQQKKPNVEKTICFAVTPHILRHTFATNLVGAGLDIKKVQYLTGHSDVTVLLKIYAHVKSSEPELASLLNAAI